MIWQTIPTWASYVTESNVLGLEKTLSDNSFLWMILVQVNTAAQEAIANQYLATLTARLQSYAESLGADIDWIYLNYAAPSQDPLGSYGEKNVAFIRDVAASYDPDGFFQTRVPGGWKISRVAQQKKMLYAVGT